VLTSAPHTPALWDEEPHEDPAAAAPAEDEDEDDEDSTEADDSDAPLEGAHPAASRPDEATDATVLRDRPTRRSRRSNRTSVPSWDEIVFGAKHD
jgi:hypothetical protein